MKTITGKLIQAGDNQHENGLPTLTFLVTREDIKSWNGSLPFYQDAIITIEGAPQPDPLADRPQQPKP